MTPSSGWIKAAVMRIQSDFLENPGLAIGPRQAQRRYGLDAGPCDAIMGALVDAGVLTRTPEGLYARYFPTFGPHSAEPAAAPTDTRHAA
jgi:hypothetical protein